MGSSLLRRLFVFLFDFYVEVENLLYIMEVLPSIRVFTDVMLIPCSRRRCSRRVTVTVQDIFDGLLQSRNKLVPGREEIPLFLPYLQLSEIAWEGIECRGQGLESSHAS
jgi:hypothetical protein